VPEKNKPEQLNDELIRKALDLDFQAVEAPPAERSWRRIEAELDPDRSRKQARAAGWTRYAAVAAAALLVIGLSSIGIMQITDLASPAADEAPMINAERDMEALHVEDEDVAVAEEEVEDEDIAVAEEEVDDVETFLEEEVVVSDLPPFEIATDPAPPEWQAVLNDNLFFEEAVLLNAGEGPDYKGAIYSGEEEVLLWVKSEADREATASFIEYLGEHIQLDTRPLQELNGYIHFEVAGQPGLAWQEDNQNQALVVILGPVSLEQLESITAELD